MSKETVISGILALPAKDQREIFGMLRIRFGDEVQLTDEQEAEMARRLELFEREGSKGEPWEVVEKQLVEGLKRARHHH